MYIAINKFKASCEELLFLLNSNIDREYLFEYFVQINPNEEISTTRRRKPLNSLSFLVPAKNASPSKPIILAENSDASIRDFKGEKREEKRNIQRSAQRSALSQMGRHQRLGAPPKARQKNTQQLQDLTSLQFFIFYHSFSFVIIYHLISSFILATRMQITICKINGTGEL